MFWPLSALVSRFDSSVSVSSSLYRCVSVSSSLYQCVSVSSSLY